jgi:hypothetical protein
LTANLGGGRIPPVTLETLAHSRPRVIENFWLALLSFLALSQTLHLFEHVAQMIQIHILGLSGPAARGIVGQLDIEWVHFTWNTWVLVALLVLIPRLHANVWLVAAVLLAAWHLTEHAVIMATYLRSGVAGTPGLLAAGGLLGGLPLARPDLHFLYNLAETVPLLLGWRVELRRAV